MKYTEPKTFDNAWNHPDPYQRKMWRNAMNKEYGDMNTRQVWRKIKRIEIPANQRCVKSKWVFKIKRDGTFRARIVACGYSQIPGVDFSDNYAPVVNDITFRLMLIVLIIYALSSKIADVETAFLYEHWKKLYSWNAHLECQEQREMKSFYFKNVSMVWYKQPDNTTRR